ncbi:flagellar hook-associated protein FlgK [Paenibacillus sp. ACRRX]|uniref:flagellar hook-associated protein FlgK n=1 Tax=unclassified Paenibacillus TaxID=185978 RepID=UPI001EF6F50A|nr:MULTISPECIES: flagellar hook-associated protein FlgK [unclassified Paenibacillus]MCG7407990.1 flagellar hook-associated protein FlgK [Paenibacillus sp. ACRRX]MDK8181629.1 flagellar hook-associated protein FlgK [Paenibacillus sp. UMB4589-SE434]
MRSTFHTLEIGKRGIVAQQLSIATTGHNITNANTPGYSRQVARLVAARPIDYPGIHNNSKLPNQMGMGVEVESITRIRDYLMDIEYRNQNTVQSTWKVQQETLGNIEGIFNEPSENSLATSISEFWNSWQLLSKNPGNSDLSSRTVVQQKAIALTETFGHISSQLKVLDSNLTERINVKISEGNNYVGQISELTQMIKRIEGLGDNANDLRDKRDLLVDQLSGLGNVQVFETDTDYQVTFGGTMVVDNMDSTNITLGDVGALTNGEIKGYIDSRDIHVANYRQQLNVIANTIANGPVEVTLPAGTILPPGVSIPNAVVDPANSRKLLNDTKYTVNGLNGLHKLGYNLQEPAQSGLDFFVASDGSGTITAENIRINQAIKDDVKNIGASMRTESKTLANGTTTEVALQGNGDMALLIASLNEKVYSFTQPGSITNSATIGGYLQSVVANLGTDADHATKMLENSTLLTSHADNLRQSVSSVSLDEEMSNLIKFQQSYSASARIVTTIDEMLDKLINGTGVVGR